MSFEWFWDWGIAALFYIIIILLIYFNRKKFDIEHKVIALYRTKFGLKLMNFIGAKHPKFIGFLGNVGIYVGFLGMLVMIGFMFFGTYQLVFVPSAPPMFSPVIPGFQIPGSPFKFPLFEGLLSLFIVVVIHEFSHGVVARAHGIKVNNSGFVMIGPIPGAFVEPDEKQLKKKSKKVQLSIFAAGPWSNIIAAFIFLLLLNGFVFLTASSYTPTGVVIEDFTNKEDVLASGRLAGFSKGDVIIGVDNVSVGGVWELSDSLVNKSPGDVVLIKTDFFEKEIVLDAHALNGSVPVVGIIANHRLDASNAFMGVIKPVYLWFVGNPYDTGFIPRLGVLGLLYVLSLGIGLVNLLPIGPTDGGRMYLLALQKFFKNDKAMLIWSKTALILVILLIFLVVMPILREIFSGLV
ncbi:site-2 protease family protein [Candidatus Woesearchaeota archaeon]|nr:site-2 protease family protein [Candidatus Woesearchaeota archaeon]